MKTLIAVVALMVLVSGCGRSTSEKLQDAQKAFDKADKELVSAEEDVIAASNLVDAFVAKHEAARKIHVIALQAVKGATTTFKATQTELAALKKTDAEERLAQMEEATKVRKEAEAAKASDERKATAEAKVEETADKKVSNLRHRLENTQLFMEVSNGWYREGGNWFWDEAKIAARPLMLSINHAEAYGVLVSQRNAATQDVVRLRKALDSQSATLKKLYDEL